MKHFFTFVLILLGQSVWAQNQVVAAEYFVDNDPGVGNATEIEITPGESISINFEVPVDDLSAGIHFLHIRVQNSADKWSLYSRKMFYVTPFNFGNNIVEAEYFFDVDPGTGSGVEIPITSGQQISESLAIPLAELEPGIHLLHVRVKTAAEKWSLYARKMFYIMPDQIDRQIMSAEYFIDTDPGVGNGIPMNVATGDSIAEAFEIVTPDTLVNGAHRLHIRVMHDGDSWSLYAVQDFSVDSTVGLEEQKISFEVFPNPTADFISVNSSGDPIAQILVIDLNGKVVYHRHELNSSNNRLDLGDLPSGTYLVQVTNASGEGISKRIVKL